MCASSAWTGASPHIDKLDLMCKRGCGYYGNPTWDGHCSKCFKELLNKKQRRAVFDPTHIKNKVSRSVSDVTEFPAKATSIVSRKLDKQQLQIGKKTKIVKDIFRLSHSSKAEAPLLPQLSSESQAVHDELHCHLKTLCEDAKIGVSKLIKLFIEKIIKVGINIAVDDLGEMFHEFYSTFDGLLTHNLSSWRLRDEDNFALKDLTEKYITTRLHGILSTNVHAQCEVKDLFLQERIRSLMWITGDHLECKIDENLDEIRNIFDEVINDLIEIDSRRTPSGKLSCLVSASNQILYLLKKSCSGTLASADDFLPALIYCLLKANPPLLQSNICYVTSFAQEASLQTGEAAYFFTSLCCAVSFIEKLTAESLCLSEVEFDHFMSGNALPANALDDAYMSDASILMFKSIKNMGVLENRMDSVLEGYDKLLIDIEEFQTNLSSEIKISLESAPLIILPRNANIDEPVPSQELLPPPLEPQAISDTRSGSSRTLSPFDTTQKSLLDVENPSSTDYVNEIDFNSNFSSENSALLDTDSSVRISVPSSSDCQTVFSSFSYAAVSPKSRRCAYLEDSLVPLELQPSVSSDNSQTTSFTLQGEIIQSIPCSTGLLSEDQDTFSLIEKTSSDPYSSIQNVSSNIYSPFQDQNTSSDPSSPIQKTSSDPFSPIQNISSVTFPQATNIHSLPPPLLPLNSPLINIMPLYNNDSDSSTDKSLNI